MKLTEKIRNQRLGEAVASGLEGNYIQDMYFIFDDDGFVSDSDVYAWGKDEEQGTWLNEQGETMQEAWGSNGIQLLINGKRIYYKFKGDIKIYGSECIIRAGVGLLDTVEAIEYEKVVVTVTSE
tara:strand:- start:2269 stop:2640 length:372 start_codon:yes stop_codon:yes gene_type:complete